MVPPAGLLLSHHHIAIIESFHAFEFVAPPALVPGFVASPDATLSIITLGSGRLIPSARNSAVRDHGLSSGAFAKPSPCRYYSDF